MLSGLNVLSYGSPAPWKQFWISVSQTGNEPVVLDMWSAQQHRRYCIHGACDCCGTFLQLLFFFLIHNSPKVLALKLQLGELGCKDVKVMEEAVMIQKREGGWRSQENVSQLFFFIPVGSLFTQKENVEISYCYSSYKWIYYKNPPALHFLFIYYS